VQNQWLKILLEFYRDENRCGTPGMETNAAGLSQKCGYEEAAFNCNAVISVYPVTKRNRQQLLSCHIPTTM